MRVAHDRSGARLAILAYDRYSWISFVVKAKQGCAPAYSVQRLERGAARDSQLSFPSCFKIDLLSLTSYTSQKHGDVLMSIMWLLASRAELFMPCAMHHAMHI